MAFRFRTLLALGITLFPSFAFAQVSLQPFSLAVHPTYPQAYGVVTITPSSSTLDLTGSTMSVSVNGVSTYSGSVAPVSATLGAPGSTTNVKVTLTSKGQSYTQTISFAATDIALVVEPRATAPVLYQGKPLTPSAGSVRVVAVANFRTSSGTFIDPSTLAYAWSVDGVLAQNASGIGKASFVTNVPLKYRSNTVSVIIKTQSGSLVGGAQTTLSGNTPTVRAYEYDPLLGILFDHALASPYTISGTEVSLFGAAYSFSTDSSLPTLSWLLNGATAQTGATLTLRPQGSGKGSASLTLSGNNDTTLENASTNLSLVFGGTQSGGLLGL